MSDKKVSVGTNTARAVIWDIARRSGVSIATVSRVLNGRPDVAAATRERVMQHVRELGYTSNRRPAGRNNGTCSYIGIVAPQLHSPYFGKIVEGASEATEERSTRLVVCLTQNMPNQESAIIQGLERDGVDGVLLLLPSQHQQDLSSLQRRGFPLVVIDPFYPLSENIPVIAAANISGARMATEHLVSLGHRRIGIIAGIPDCCATIDRLAGYHSVLVGVGIPNFTELIVAGDFTAEGGRKAAHQLLTRPDPPTAIFAMNDDMAIGALQAAQERGIRVPQQLSVVGYDDGEFASFVTPMLTTVRQPLKELGRVGTDILYRLINGQPLEANRVELSTKLIVRDSTGRCP